jgi:DNA-binding CsgD family transcriptional regulator
VTEALRARDLRTVLDFARAIGEAESLDAYRSAVLERAPTLVTGDVYGYNEVPPRRAQPLIQMSAYPSSELWWDSLVRLAEEHPLVVHYIATGDPEARAISDLVGRRAYEGGEFYRDVLSYVSGRDQLAVSIPGRDGLTIGLAVNRGKRGFSQRDHAVYDAVRPFLLHGYRNALAREHARAVTEALGATADAVDQPVVLVARDGRIEHLTPGAGELLAEMGFGAIGRLTEPLAGWLRTQRGRAVPLPLRINGCTARLVRDAAPGFDAIALTISERGLSIRALSAIGLTRREAEVIALVAAGKTNAEVGGTLGIAEATVAKHMQHVNEKLGVTSRTAAVARARELVTGLI